MDAKCGFETNSDGTAMGDTRPMRALLRAEARLAGTFRGVAANRKAVCLYLLAIVAWWALLRFICGFSVTVPVLLPQPRTHTMVAVPTIVLVAVGAVVGVLYLPRFVELKVQILVLLTVTGPSAAAIVTNEAMLHSPGEVVTHLLIGAAATTLGAFLGALALRVTNLEHPRRVLATTVVVFLFALSAIPAAYAIGWREDSQCYCYNANVDTTLAVQARRLEDGWYWCGMDGRATLCDDYITLAYRTLGSEKDLPLVIEAGSMEGPHMDGYPTVGMAYLATTREDMDMVRKLDDMAARMALDHLGDERVLWVLSPDADDPTVAAWARTEGVRYGEALGGTVAGNEATYCEMAESLLSYVRREGEGDVDVQA